LPDLKTIRQQLSSDDEKERWRGAADLGEYVFDHPEEAWPLVLEFGSSAVEDTRSAIATCVLEHILEHHFDVYFPVLGSCPAAWCTSRESWLSTPTEI
jgi:hypothetical protein